MDFANNNNHTKKKTARWSSGSSVCMSVKACIRVHLEFLRSDSGAEDGQCKLMMKTICAYKPIGLVWNYSKPPKKKPKYLDLVFHTIISWAIFTAREPFLLSLRLP